MAFATRSTLSVQDTTPTAVDLLCPEHVLQIYENPHTLLATVTEFLSLGLAAGEPLVVIARPERYEALARAFAAQSIDADRLKRSGQLLMLDAGATLAQLMVGDGPNRELFQQTVESRLMQGLATVPRARARVYSEWVDMLWVAGTVKGALALEEMWNELALKHMFSLLCAHGVTDFHRDHDGRAFRDLCCAHTHVLTPLPWGNAAMESQDLAILQQHTLTLENEIAARRELEVTLRETLKQRRQVEDSLRQSNRDLDQFAAFASHDLKAPLRAISTLLEWIGADATHSISEESKGHLALARGRVEKMEGLIDAILSYSHVGRQVPLETVDVKELIAEIIATLSPPAHIELLVEPMPVLQTERVPLYQVLQNLIDNAVKYTRVPAPKIVIDCEPEGPDAVHFRVKDNGPGIPAHFHNRVWQFFTRVEARDGVEGNGIGLSVVRKIVELRCGKAWVESKPGEGATFHFTWPTTVVATKAAAG